LKTALFVAFNLVHAKNCIIRHSDVQLHLDAYLEGWIHPKTDDLVYLFCESTTETAPTSMTQVYTNQCMKVIWNSREFKSMYDQVGDTDDRKGLDTHLNRNYASTQAKRRGGDIDQVEYRGRLTGKRTRGSMCPTPCSFW
jgi:hypothetical protein